MKLKDFFNIRGLQKLEVSSKEQDGIYTLFVDLSGECYGYTLFFKDSKCARIAMLNGANGDNGHEHTTSCTLDLHVDLYQLCSAYCVLWLCTKCCVPSTVCTRGTGDLTAQTESN